MSSVAEAAPPRDRLTGGWELPRRWHWLIRGFRRYAHRYVRKHFHAVRLSKSGSLFPVSAAVPAAGDNDRGARGTDLKPTDPFGGVRPGRPRSQEGEPLLVVLNHPSWWDPMICIVLSSLMRERDQFAAIDAVAVERYAFFKRLGFVGVDTKTLRGAAEFVRAGTTILAEPNRVFWVTAQGRFTDVRERPLRLQGGVGHLAARLTRGAVLPVALEYTFWTERTPEALTRIGEPLHVPDHIGRSGKEWLTLIEDAMTRNLDVLNAEAMTRDPAKFTAILGGTAGVGGIYDRWRRVKAWFRGEKFDPSHEATMRGERP